MQDALAHHRPEPQVALQEGVKLGLLKARLVERRPFVTEAYDRGLVDVSRLAHYQKPREPVGSM